MSLTQSVADSMFNLADSFAFAAGIPITGADSLDNLGDALNNLYIFKLQFEEKLSIKDKLFADFLLTLDLADNLEAWSDALSKLNLGLYTIDTGDDLSNLSDLLIQRLDHRVKLGSSIVGHADKVELLKGIRLSLGDDMNLNSWLDSISINPVLDLTLSLIDTLAMSDNLAILLSTRATTGLKSSFESYIRKYLNDPLVGN